MKNYLLFFICLCLGSSLFAQRDARWLLGTTGAGGNCCAFEMIFPGDTFEVQPVTRDFSATAFLSGDGVISTSANICNNAGENLLHCDGYVLRNAIGDTLENGKLQMNASMWWDGGWGQAIGVFRSYFFIDKPNAPNKYYFIYPYETLQPYSAWTLERLNAGLLLAEIDMEANNGKGAVLSHTYFLQDTIRQLSVSVTKHANGRDWWVVAPDYKKNKYYRLLIDNQGVHTYPPQTIGNTPIYDPLTLGSAYFSQDGSKYVVDGPDDYKVMNFNRCTGLLSNYKEIRGINQACPKGDNYVYIVYSTLSPNNRFLYVSDISHNGPNCVLDDMQYNRLYQYDLWDADPALNPIVLMESDATLTSNGTGSISAPFLTPNGMIVLNYHNTGPATTFNMIRDPNMKGIACQPVRIPHQSSVPYTFSTLPNYSLGALIGSPCDTLQTSGIQVSSEDRGITLYPNPTEDKITVHLPTEIGQNWELHNAMGVCVYQATQVGTTHEISLADLPQGVYVLVVRTKNNRIFTEKVRKE